MKNTVLPKSIYMEIATEGGEGIALVKVYDRNEVFPCLIREKYSILNPENKVMQINLYTSNSEEKNIAYRNAEKLGNITLEIPVWRAYVWLEFKFDEKGIEIKALDEKYSILGTGCLEI